MMNKRMERIIGFHRRSAASQKNLLAAFLSNVNTRPMPFVQ